MNSCFGLGKFGKKSRIVFIVDVFVAHSDHFELIAENIPLRKPVMYKESSIQKAVEEQHPKLYREKLLGKGWTVEIKEWRR